MPLRWSRLGKARIGTRARALDRTGLIPARRDFGFASASQLRGEKFRLAKSAGHALCTTMHALVSPDSWGLNADGESAIIHIVRASPAAIQNRQSRPGRPVLIDNPLYLTISEWGTLTIGDSKIRPAMIYGVQAVSTTAQSAIATATTWTWGDVNNDGIIDLADIFCELDGYRSDFSVCALEAVDPPALHAGRRRRIVRQSGDARHLRLQGFPLPHPVSVIHDGAAAISNRSLSVRAKRHGRYRTRTCGLLLVREAL